jgi:YD repeat-containing protein
MHFNAGMRVCVNTSTRVSLYPCMCVDEHAYMRFSSCIGLYVHERNVNRGWRKACIHVGVYAFRCVHACMDERVYACLYVCMYVCMCVCIFCILWQGITVHAYRMNRPSSKAGFQTSASLAKAAATWIFFLKSTGRETNREGRLVSSRSNARRDCRLSYTARGQATAVGACLHTKWHQSIW